MRMNLQRGTRTLTSTLALAAAGCLVAGSLSAAPLDRLVSDFQPGEVSTSTPAMPGGAGGTVVYQKAVTVPDALDVLYITFSAAADAHNGSALLMNATVAPGTGPHPETLCQPLASLVPDGGNTVTGWYNLLKLPQPPLSSSNRCMIGGLVGDGGGGTADCHDNTIYFSCCARLITPDTTATVRIRLANLPGGDANTSFYEKSTIYVDGVSDPNGHQCTTHGVP